MSYDPHQTFAEEAFRNFAKTAGGFLPMNTGTCIYIDGVHIRGATNSYGQKICPHESAGNEIGEVLPDGWTVQSDDKEKRYQQLLVEVNNASKKN